MRFLVLQQVGGDLYGVYDMSLGDMVRVFDGKKAKQRASELQAILETGWQASASTEGSETLRKMRDALLSRTEG